MMFHHTDPFAATAGFIRNSSSTVWRPSIESRQEVFRVADDERGVAYIPR